MKSNFKNIAMTLIMVLSLMTPSSMVFAAENGSNDDYLHTNGNKILDSKGNEVRMTGIAWFGFETPNNSFHGLWANTLEDILL